jgi:CO/xanthine dehydrogenase Mo-binding subunit
MPIRTSSLRSLGAHCNVFASESFVDEVATSVGADPLVFRLRHLTDQRAKDVLQAAADMANWEGLTLDKLEGQGVGIAFARYKNTGAWCAVVAAVDTTQELRIRNLWIAVDVGRAVHQDGIVNQIEGGAIQAVSWTLKEAVQFDRTRITSNTWDTYPILRFSEVPTVTVQVINRPKEKSLGAGEATNGPVSAAIANAVFNALGVRARDLPLTMDALTKAALTEENA